MLLIGGTDIRLTRQCVKSELINVHIELYELPKCQLGSAKWQHGNKKCQLAGLCIYIFIWWWYFNDQGENLELSERKHNFCETNFTFYYFSNRVQYGCPVSIKLPIIDPDGDNVQCRWATPAEAATISRLLPNAHLNQVCNVREKTTKLLYPFAISFPHS